MKYFFFIIFIFIINCSSNKVSNYHGFKSLEKKYEIIIINKSNKNDIIKLIGYPSMISKFDQDKWFYVERQKVNQSLFKLGTQKIKKNNILIVELNDNGILKNKSILTIDDMNKINYVKKTTKKDYKKDDFVYKLFTSLREKINSPVRNRSK